MLRHFGGWFSAMFARILPDSSVFCVSSVDSFLLGWFAKRFFSWRVVGGAGVVCLALCEIPQATASPLKAPHIELSLRSEVQAVRPGLPFWIGVHQKIEKHWHTYWQNPGDSGIAPKIRWVVPAGFQVGSIQWPTPKRIRVRVLANFGYEDEILLPLQITPPKQTQGTHIKISASLNWLVCKEECIPGSGTIHLTLPIQQTTPPSTQPTPPSTQPSPRASTDQQAFVAVRRQLPQPWPATQGKLVIRDEDVQIDLPHLPDALLQRKHLTFYPIDHSVISNAAPLKFSRHQGVLRLTVEKNEYHTPERNRLRGLIVSRDPHLPMLSYAVLAQVPPNTTRNNAASVATAPSKAVATAPSKAVATVPSKAVVASSDSKNASAPLQLPTSSTTYASCTNECFGDNTTDTSSEQDSTHLRWVSCGERGRSRVPSFGVVGVVVCVLWWVVAESDAVCVSRVVAQTAALC